MWCSSSRAEIGFGSAGADCVAYRAVAEIGLKRKAARKLSRRLERRAPIGLKAKFVLASTTLSSRLSLEKPETQPQPRPPARAAQRRTGETFVTGWLSCGRGTNLISPGLRLFVPGTSASGNRTDSFGQFYNDTNDDNWVWYQPYIYEYGHGWVWSDDWRGPIYVPPYSTQGIATAGDHLLNANAGYDAYLAGAVYVWWYNGYRDWNYVVADSPSFGYNVSQHLSLPRSMISPDVTGRIGGRPFRVRQRVRDPAGTRLLGMSDLGGDLTYRRWPLRRPARAAVRSDPRYHDALNRGDFDAWLEFRHSDAELHELAEMPGTPPSIKVTMSCGSGRSRRMSWLPTGAGELLQAKVRS